MTSFVRKNLLTFTGTCFLPGESASTPPSKQPSAGVMVLRFKNTSFVWTVVTIALTASGSPNYTWTGTWDSSACEEGTVSWTMYFSGPVQAAQEGCFFVNANRSNTF